MIPFRLVDDLWQRAELVNNLWHGRAGDEGLGCYSSTNDGEATAGILFVCPGCRQITFCNFRMPDRAVWTWDGDRERPTLTPSIVHNKDRGGCGWHGYLTKGEFRPC